MKSRSVLIVGCGDLGIRCGLSLAAEGAAVTGVRRDVSRLPDGIAGQAADYTVPGSLDFAATLAPDYVIATFNPFDRSVDGYKAGFARAMDNLLSGLGEHRPRHIIMASSTRVYAESEGGWVDEASALTGSDPFAAHIIAAERALLDSGQGATVVRFAGIYGIPGGRLLSRVRRGELCPAEPVSYTNRIHREDAGAFLAHLVHKAGRGEALLPVYNGVDNLPAPRYEVECWLARQMGLEDLVAGAAPLGDPTRHNRAGHKRVGNGALRDSGFELVYPDFRAGYGALLEH